MSCFLLLAAATMELLLKMDNQVSDFSKKLWLVVLTGAAFGSSVVFARIALREVNPYTVAVLRFGIASAAYMLTLPLLRKRFFTDANRLKQVTVVGIVGTGLPLLLFYFALGYLSSGIFSALLAALPLFTAIIAHYFLAGERISPRLLAGLLISFVGVLLLIATKSNGLSGVFDIRGPLIALTGIVLAATGAVYARKKLAKADPLVVSASQSIAAFIFITTLVLLMGKWELGDVSASGWFAIFYNGIVGSYIAFWLTFILIKRYGATASSLPGYVMPVVSALLGAVMLGELITLPLVLGAAVILGGVFFASTKSEEVRE